MPNCDFYAVPEDWLQIVQFIFTNDGWILYELSSEFDAKVRAFRSLDAVKAILRPDHESYEFQLYSPAMGGRVEFRKITLRPGAIPGKTFRYSTEGWGLIQFYVHQPRDGKLRPCHTNHNSVRRAETWAPVRDVQVAAGPDDWNWRHVSSMSNRLNRYIRKLGVAKRGSRAILPAAQLGLESGRLQFLG